jgi:hypothetical protein
METKQDNTEVSAILAGMAPDQRAKIEAAMKKVAAKRTSEAEIRKIHANVVENSVKYNEVAKKQVAVITCSISGCKETREVFTSDLHQVKTCLSHRKEQRKAARQSRAAEQKRLIEAGKAAQIKA